MSQKDEKLREMDIALSHQAPYRVGIFPTPGFALMSYASTVEPLRAANLLSRRRLYEIHHFGATERVASSGAAELEPAGSVGDLPALDLLLVVAGGDPFAFKNAATFAWLRALDRRGVGIGGVSGGAVLLARAGLLNGRRMTVHWEHAAALSRAYPDLWIERRLYVIDRDRVTCGGGTAPLDLMHALIRRHHGRAFARLVSDWFLHTEVRAPGAPQRGGLTERLGNHSQHVIEAVEVMENHVADPLNLTQIALVAGVTPRHLNRLFAQSFGCGAMAYYRDLRLDVAKRLVTASPMPVADIAEATGFANAGHFSNAYKSKFNIRPRTDRRSRIALH